MPPKPKQPVPTEGPTRKQCKYAVVAPRPWPKPDDAPTHPFGEVAIFFVLVDCRLLVFTGVQEPKRDNKVECTGIAYIVSLCCTKPRD